MAGKRDAVAAVYAQALIELAYGKGTPAEVLADLRQLQKALDPRTLSFLRAPHIRKESKKQALDEALNTRVSDTVLNFLKVLIDKGRQAELPAILEQFESQYHDLQGELVAEVKSAIPLQDADKTRLKAALKKRWKKEIVLEERVEPGLLGGLVIRVGDSVVDGSLRHRLATIAGRLQVSRMPSTEMFAS